MKKVLIGVVILIGLVFIFSQKPQTVKVEEASVIKEVKQDDLELLKTEIVDKGYGFKYVVGTLQNKSGKEFKYVELDFNLYDEKGDLVGSTLTNIQNLEADSLWHFEAVVTSEKAESFKLKEIKAY